VASKYVPGPPLGPFLFDGVRKDDPNDHYRHEHRRDLRGLNVVSAWLNHVDMRFMNTMDAYVSSGHIRHYLIDFAASLGSGTIRPHEPREGTEYNFDFWPTMGRMFTLGFYQQGWEGREYEVIHPSIGWMQVEDFEPGSWKANWPNGAFRNMTVRDAYWGAKLVGSFTDEQIRAAVDAGRLPSEFAADTLARILMHRRDRIIEHWYSRVSPVERVEVERATSGGGPRAFVLAFDDLGIRDRAWEAEDVYYEWELLHAELDRKWSGLQDAGAGVARQRLRIGPAAGQETGREATSSLSSERAIATLHLRVLRRDEGKSDRAATIYLRWDVPGDGYRVAGLVH
jgi:hypothetical protein